MSAHRKLSSVLSLSLSRWTRTIAPRPAAFSPVPRSRSRSISTSRTLFRPSAAEKVSETTKDDSKPVPSEQITEEAKKAEPDAAEQVENMEKKGMDPLPTQT